MRRSLSLSEPLSLWLLLAVGSSCALLLMSQERALPPQRTPSLSLPSAQVAAALAKDDKRAQAALGSDEAFALRDLLLQQGKAEEHVIEDVASYRDRREALRKADEALRSKAGDEAALALRARFVARFEEALDEPLPDDQVQGVVGAFPSLLVREGAVRDGYMVAPSFVVRVLYKARLNVLCGVSPDYGFERIERRAFFGWQALHAEHLPTQQRVDALAQYQGAGGERGDEALGILLYSAGDFTRAAQALSAAYRRSGSIRLRNQVLGAKLQAELAAPSGS